MLGTCVDRGIRIVTNAGGLNPAGCADAVRAVAERLGVHRTGRPHRGRRPARPHRRPPGRRPRPRPPRHRRAARRGGHRARHRQRLPRRLGHRRGARRAAPTSSCARGSPTPRSWSAPRPGGTAGRRDDWDQLAGAVVAGHVLECGAQATGGNYAFFTEVPDLDPPGLPARRGGTPTDRRSSPSTPAPAALVSVGTVTAQLLYEIAEPAYANPDVVARFDSIRLDRRRTRPGADQRRPRRAGARQTTKVAHQPPRRVPQLGARSCSPASISTPRPTWLERSPLRRPRRRGGLRRGRRPARSHGPADARTTTSGALLRVTVKDPDAAKVGRAFSGAAVELALASYPGFHLTSPPARRLALRRLLAGARAGVGDPTRRGARRRSAHRHRRATWFCATGHASRRRSCRRSRADRTCAGRADRATGRWATSPAPGRATRAATPTSASGRARDEAYAWLAATLTVERLRQLLPETAGLDVHRYALAQPAGPELRRARPARRRRGRLDTVRSAGQGAGRAATSTHRGHPRNAALSRKLA